MKKKKHKAVFCCCYDVVELYERLNLFRLKIYEYISAFGEDKR